jgi:rare lipoprotein A
MLTCISPAKYCSLNLLARAPCLLPLLLAACASQPLSAPAVDPGLQLADIRKQPENAQPAAMLAAPAEGISPAEHPQKTACNRPYNIKGRTYYPLQSAKGYQARGMASWYGTESGNRTASGSRFNPHALSAAHKTLPIPSWVKVTNLSNGRSIEVVINDRGPFHDDKLIDLSKGAAEQIGMRGLTEVSIEYLGS